MENKCILRTKNYDYNLCTCNMTYFCTLLMTLFGVSLIFLMRFLASSFMKPNNFWVCWLMAWNTVAVLILEPPLAVVVSVLGSVVYGNEYLILSCLVREWEKKKETGDGWKFKWTIIHVFLKMPILWKISPNCMCHWLMWQVNACRMVKIRNTCTCKRIVTCTCNGHMSDMTLTGGRSKFSPNLSGIRYNWVIIASTVGLLFESKTRQAPGNKE